MAFRRRALTSLVLGFLLVFSCAAFAGNGRDHTQVGHDIYIGPGEEASDVTCFGCSVHIRGRVHTEVTVFGGNVVVEDDGSVGTDVTAFGGSVHLNNKATVGGDVTVFGGRIHRDPQSSIGGDVTNFGGAFWLPVIFALPLIFLGALVGLIVWIVRRITRNTAPAPA